MNTTGSFSFFSFLKKKANRNSCDRIRKMDSIREKSQFKIVVFIKTLMASNNNIFQFHWKHKSKEKFESRVVFNFHFVERRIKWNQQQYNKLKIHQNDYNHLVKSDRKWAFYWLIALQSVFDIIVFAFCRDTMKLKTHNIFWNKREKKIVYNLSFTCILYHISHSIN